MKKKTIQSYVKNGTLDMEKRLEIGQFLKTIEDGEKVVISIAKYYLPRSNKQNRYYWGVVVSYFSDWSGYEPREAHEILKALFSREPKKVGDKEIMVPRSTTDMKTWEFEEFMAEVRRYMAVEHQVSIPLPNECEMSFMYDYQHFMNKTEEKD